MKTCGRCGRTLTQPVCLRCLSTRLQNRPKRASHRSKKRSDRVAGIALTPELRRLAALPVFGGQQSRLADNLPHLHVRRATAKPKRRLAFADYNRHLIHLTAYPNQTPEEALETLLHEIVHLSDLELRRHDLHFKQILAEAAFQGFGVDCRESVGLAVYALDRAIVDTWTAQGGVSGTSPTSPCPQDLP